MADQSNLLLDLQEYRAALAKHLNQFQGSLPELNKRWYALNSVYEGDAAEEFKSNWKRTAEWLQNHVHEVENMLVVLDEHIQALQQFDFPQKV